VPKKKIAILTISLVTLAGLIVSLVMVLRLDPKPTKSVQSTLVDQQTLSNLPKKSVSGIDTSHLAPALIPPTNNGFVAWRFKRILSQFFPVHSALRQIIMVMK
jgi:hypothetical protein